MKKRIVSLILVITTLFSLLTVTANAASNEEYLSEVALVYEDSVEDAKAAIAGTDWKLLEYDLNADADYMIDDGVYLIYKTSTNVEDAITDLRVMDMYGGYETSNYEKQLEASRDHYAKIVKYVRTAAAEFKALYEAGDEMAKLAYRQMNYYKDTKTEGGTETDMLMGDFFLNMPSDDKVVQMMMEGNGFAVTNLISLLAIGISNAGGKNIATKISEMYAVKSELTDEEFYNKTKKIYSEFVEFSADVKRYNALESEYNLNDEDINDEEFEFLTKYGVIAGMLAQIPYGDETLREFVVKNHFTVMDFYPVTAALSEGQYALAEMGALTTILQYSAPSASIDELNALLDELEVKLVDENGKIVPVDVYAGVDRSIFDGDFAFTNAAERNQALTGIEWTPEYYDDNMKELNKNYPDAVVKSLIVSGFAVAIGVEVLKDITAHAAATAIKAATGAAAEKAALSTVSYKISSFLIGTPGQTVTPFKILFGAGFGLVIAGIGIYAITSAYGYYNPDYTPIPNSMIDVRETDTGDKYIKYTVAKVYNDEEGRNADFNAYEGKEWIALYYTKDASAGKCLLPTFVCKADDSSVARRHQGVSMFGESKAFNLNSHVFGKNAPGIYLTLRYSTAKKAAADVPNVIGSLIIGGGYYALTAFAGAGVGVGIMTLTQYLRKKKQDVEENIPEEASTEN